MTYGVRRSGFAAYAFAYGLPFLIAFLNISLIVLHLDWISEPNDPEGLNK